MEKDISILAKIAYVDKILDEFEDELGDLPKAINSQEVVVSEKKDRITETEGILNDIKVFVSTAKSTLVALKEKEDKLSQQQFLVRNNKEFDAISTEIKSLKSEHEKLSVKMRTEGIKEGNLLSILDDQKKELEDAIERLAEVHRQYDELTEEQSEDVQNYNKIRKQLRTKINDTLYDRYAVIRARIPDAAVQVKRGSCQGCYRQIPSQLIVDMRNQLDRIFQCENCGRILIPDWVEFDEDDLLADKTED
ncbi:MAG: C4-type zinc ribbon domain-containing protein [Ignavibacteria bacterium]|jgi:predicted  nucleic acid-binding Zn-ribbon protein|nr:C4-type zinc ribbon domain-containing protein [Ignavibacteria bacterium]